MKSLRRVSRVKPAGILLLSAATIVILVIAVRVNSARSDSPVPEAKQDLHDLFLNPPTPDPSLPTTLATKASTEQYETPVPIPDGIAESSQAPYSSIEFKCTNRWAGHLGNLLVIVYAGAAGRETKDPGRGLLMVDTYSDVTPGGAYEAPPSVGSLRITGFTENLLTAEATTGETFYFDAETREFTDANGDPVPTDTPTPTYPPPHTPGPTISPEPDSETPTPTVAPSAIPSATFAPPTSVVGG